MCMGGSIFPLWRMLHKWQCASSSLSHQALCEVCSWTLSFSKKLGRPSLHMLFLKLIVDSSLKEIRAVVTADLALRFPKQQESSDNRVEVLVRGWAVPEWVRKQTSACQRNTVSAWTLSGRSQGTKMGTCFSLVFLLCGFAICLLYRLSEEVERGFPAADCSGCPAAVASK